MNNIIDKNDLEAFNKYVAFKIVKCLLGSNVNFVMNVTRNIMEGSIIHFERSNGNKICSLIIPLDINNEYVKTNKNERNENLAQYITARVIKETLSGNIKETNTIKSNRENLKKLIMNTREVKNVIIILWDKSIQEMKSDYTIKYFNP